jgi:hypothetical protein
VTRRGLVGLCLVLLLGCGSDRARPGLVSPDTPLQMFVQVVSPRSNESVEAGREISIRVSAFETFKRLEGIGVLIHRFGTAGPLDSTVVRFAPTADSAHTFIFRVPPSLPTNTQLDIRGIAIGPNDQSRRTPGINVIVIACSPAAEWCR